HRTSDAQQQAKPTADAPARQRKRTETPQPAKPPRNRTAARLDRLYADRTGPDALREDRRRSQPAPQNRPTPESKPTASTPEHKPAPKKRRSVAKRLDELYERDARGSKDDPKAPGKDRRRRQPPPRRPGGPSI
ncbi:MAG: hypothetical protein JO285_07600, partial [Kutzneria sp.]|nr:hypothetical protein [Kutzneria sp.]